MVEEGEKGKEKTNSGKGISLGKVSNMGVCGVCSEK